jgi:hypothetical protein
MGSLLMTQKANSTQNACLNACYKAHPNIVSLKNNKGLEKIFKSIETHCIQI